MKTLAVVFAAGSLGAGLVVVHLMSELGSVRDQVAQLRTRVEQLQSARMAAARQSAAVPIALPATAQVPTTADIRVQAAVPAREVVTKEVLEYELHRARQAVSMLFPDYERVLGLGPAELEKFTDLLARQVMERDRGTTAALADRPAEPAAMQETLSTLREGKQRRDAEIAAMLGSRYPLWQKMEETRDARSTVHLLQNDLGANRISDANYESLVTALHAETKRITQERDFANRYSRMLSAATPFLNPGQAEVYRQQLERSRSMATAPPGR